MAKQARKATAPVRKIYDPAESHRRIVAAYDAARTTTENESLWKYVDSMSAAAANSPGVRQTIRDRARYEASNNSYARGIVDTLANDVVGPVVQLQLGDSEFAQSVERHFEAWAAATNIWSKIRTSQRAKTQDGEVFPLMITNRRLGHEIKLDIRLIECDQVEGWFGNVGREDEIDGVRLDENGVPTHYRLLKQHPGDYRTLKGGSPLAGDWVSAKYMLHYFTSDRPGQVRGISELLPALSLFGQLRRYTSAVIETASRAAEISSVMHTDLMPEGAAELADPVTIIEAERNAILSLPEGWKLTQLKPEQPTTQYGDFKSEIINEIARCLNMPFNVAAGNSSGYNYASGRLDHQTYDRSIEVRRQELQQQVLDPILRVWVAEYAARHSLTSEQAAELMDHEWHFAGRDHVDPAKEANADNVRLANGTLNYATYYARRGKDWKREERQRIRELIAREQMWHQAREDAGLSPAPYPGTTDTNQAVPIDQEEAVDED